MLSYKYDGMHTNLYNFFSVNGNDTNDTNDTKRANLYKKKHSERIQLALSVHRVVVR